MPESKSYLNPHLAYPRADWPRRATPIQLEDYTGKMWSFAINTTSLSLTMWIQRLRSATSPLLSSRCCISKRSDSQSLDKLEHKRWFKLADQMVIPTFSHSLRNSRFCMEMAEHYKLEEVDKVDPHGAGGESAPVFEWQFENKDTLVVNDEPLKMDSSIGFLARSC